MIPQVQVGAQPCRGAWLRTSTGQQHTHVHTHTHTRPIIARNTAGTHIHRTGHDMEDRGRRARLSSLGPHRTPLEAQAPVAMPCPQAQLCWILRAGPAPTMTPTGSWPWARSLSVTTLHSRAQPSKPSQDWGLLVSPASQPSWWGCAGSTLHHAGTGLSLGSSFWPGAGEVAMSCCAAGRLPAG